MEFLINHWRGCPVVFLPIIVIFTSSLILNKGLEAQILTRDGAQLGRIGEAILISYYTMFAIKPVAVICSHQVINGSSFFLRTMFHGKIANSVNLINHCTKIYNPASIFVKNCEP